MSRQVGIDNSDSKYFTFLDSDDVFMPHTIAIITSTLQMYPTIEVLTSQFLVERYENGFQNYYLLENGSNQCHGKVYRRDKINQFEIRNRPDIKWADDSYFNSMVTELLSESVINMPLYIWTDNKASVTRCLSETRDRQVINDFLKALLYSANHVLKYKDVVTYLEPTLKSIDVTKLDSVGLQYYSKLLDISSVNTQVLEKP